MIKLISIEQSYDQILNLPNGILFFDLVLSQNTFIPDINFNEKNQTFFMLNETAKIPRVKKGGSTLTYNEI